MKEKKRNLFEFSFLLSFFSGRQKHSGTVRFTINPIGERRFFHAGCLIFADCTI
jgi:hypothetical protein